MKKNIIVATLCIASLPLLGQRVTELKTDTEKLSYSIGVNLAQNFKQQDMADEIDMRILSQAFEDEVKGEGLVFPLDSMNSFMQGYFEKKAQEQQKKREVIGAKNKEEGQAFLQQNKNKKGIKTTLSGLQYEVIKKGTGSRTPKPEDMVKVKYEGKLLDGTIFDSTDKNNNGEPIEFQLNQVIKGWTEGVSLMTEGSVYRFYIPSELAYGENGAGAIIGPNAVLIFDVELIAF